MTDPYRDHPSEEALERFLLKRLSQAELEVVETHILACEFCVEQLETLEVLIAATKLTTLHSEAGRTQLQSPKASGGWLSSLTAKLSLMGALTALAIGAVTFSVPRDVTLSTYRGQETPIVTTWRPLHLKLNATDLAEGPVIVELVDNAGASVWKGSAAVHNDEVKVTLPRITTAGSHFVRIYAIAQSNTESDLLREFAFQVK
jgi:hypothetical protein